MSVNSYICDPLHCKTKENMNRIRDWLYIGKYRETTDLQLLQSTGISAMLLLAEAVELPGIASLYLPVEDGVPIPVELLEQGIAYALECRLNRKTLLVACGAGISRSAAFAIAILKISENLSLENAFREVRRCHPETLPHPALWRTLCDRFGETIPYMTLIKNRL